MLIAVVAGVILFPMMLPLLPFKYFVARGALLGTVVTAPFIIATLQSAEGGGAARAGHRTCRRRC